MECQGSKRGSLGLGQGRRRRLPKALSTRIRSLGVSVLTSVRIYGVYFRFVLFWFGLFCFVLREEITISNAAKELEG